MSRSDEGDDASAEFLSEVVGPCTVVALAPRNSLEGYGEDSSPTAMESYSRHQSRHSHNTLLPLERQSHPP